MKSDWLKGATGAQEKEDRRELVATAKPTLRVLKKVLEQVLQEKQAAAAGTKSYESASWPYLQADHLGEQRALLYVIDLLTLDQEA